MARQRIVNLPEGWVAVLDELDGGHDVRLTLYKPDGAKEVSMKLGWGADAKSCINHVMEGPLDEIQGFVWRQLAVAANVKPGAKKH